MKTQISDINLLLYSRVSLARYECMYDQHSQALSTRRAPLETGSRKRSGLFVIFKRINLRLVLKHSTITDAPQTERQLQHPWDAVVAAYTRVVYGRSQETTEGNSLAKGCEPHKVIILSTLDVPIHPLIFLSRIIIWSSNGFFVVNPTSSM